MSDKEFNLHSLIMRHEPSEITIPARTETFEAQVVTFSRERTETTYPHAVSMTYPMQETQRLIASKRYRLEFVPSHIHNGKPTILLYEEEEQVQV